MSKTRAYCVVGIVCFTGVPAAFLACSSSETKPDPARVASDASNDGQGSGEGGEDGGSANVPKTVAEAIGCSVSMGADDAGAQQFTMELDVPLKDFVPLCGGSFFFPHTANKVVLQTFDGPLMSYALSGTPTRLAFDPAHKRLFAAVLPSSLARIDLTTSVVTSLTLPLPANQIAMGRDGHVVIGFAGDELDDATGVFVDGDSLAISAKFAFAKNSVREREMDLFAYDSNTRALLISDYGISGGPALRRFTEDPDAGAGDPDAGDDGGADATVPTVMFVETNPGINGANSEQLRLSPDFAHLVYVNGGGNVGASGYVISDLDPVSFMSKGEWDTGAYPTAAGFRLDNSELVATPSYPVVQFFSVAMHTKTRTDYKFDTTTLDPKKCSFPTFQWTEFSRDGNTIMAAGNCKDSTSNDAAHGFVRLLQ